jgi:hypothetical protein
MPLFEKVGTLYGKNSGMLLRQEFHYEPISTCVERTKSLLLCGGYLPNAGDGDFKCH